MDYAKEYDRMVEQSNKQQAHIEQLQARLQDVDRGLDIAERKLTVAVQGKHEDAPFPLDENEAKLWHRAQASAYQHALEMCNSTSLKAFIENGFKDTAPFVRKFQGAGELERTGYISPRPRP